MYLFTAQVGNSNEWTGYITTGSQGNCESFDGLIVCAERGIASERKRHVLSVHVVVVRECLKLSFDVFNSALMAWATDGTVLSRCAVGNFLEDLSLGVQVVDMESIAERLLSWILEQSKNWWAGDHTELTSVL